MKEYGEIVAELSAAFPDIRQENIQSELDKMLEGGMDLNEAEVVVRFVLAGAFEAEVQNKEPAAYFTVWEILVIPEKAKNRVRKFMSRKE